MAKNYELTEEMVGVIIDSLKDRIEVFEDLIDFEKSQNNPVSAQQLTDELNEVNSVLAVFSESRL